MQIFYHGIMDTNNGMATALFIFKAPIDTEEEMQYFLGNLSEDAEGFCKKAIKDKGFPIIDEDKIEHSAVLYEKEKDHRFATIQVKWIFKEGRYK